jgi:hypothetical protein
MVRGGSVRDGGMGYDDDVGVAKCIYKLIWG